MKMKIAKLFASVSGNYDYRYIVIQYVIQLQTITSLCITNEQKVSKISCYRNFRLQNKIL